MRSKDNVAEEGGGSRQQVAPDLEQSVEVVYHGVCIAELRERGYNFDLMIDAWCDLPNAKGKSDRGLGSIQAVRDDMGGAWRQGGTRERRSNVEVVLEHLQQCPHDKLHTARRMHAAAVHGHHCVGNERGNIGASHTSGMESDLTNGGHDTPPRKEREHHVHQTA